MNNIKETIFTDCPIRNVLSHICSKWSLLVIYVMSNNKSMRFNAIHKSIPDISQKVLTSTLRSLEADGFLSRDVYAEVPPRVEYSLTPRAYSFLPVMNEIIVWASENMVGIMKNRAEHALK